MAPPAIHTSTSSFSGVTPNLSPSRPSPPPPAPPPSSFRFVLPSSSTSQSQQQSRGFSALQNPTASSAAAAASASLSASAAAASSFFSTLTSTLAAGTFPPPMNKGRPSAGSNAGGNLSESDVSGGRRGSSSGTSSGVSRGYVDSKDDVGHQQHDSDGFPHFPSSGSLGDFVEDDDISTVDTAVTHRGGGGGPTAELQKRLRRRERELRAAVNRLRFLEESSITQETERYQERQLLADVLKQNHLLPERKPPRKSLLSKRTGDEGGEASRDHSMNREESFEEGGREDNDEASSSSAEEACDGVILTADEALVGIQKLANLLRQLEEENRVLFLFAQMVFPTYSSFAQSNTYSHRQHVRRPQLDFEELRTRWLELEEDRSVATVQAQQAALAHARQLEVQTVEQQKKIEDLTSSVAELRAQLGKVTKEKALLLVNHMQQRTAGSNTGKSGVSTEDGRSDILAEARLRGCPQCAAVAAAAAKAVEAAASAAMASASDKGDVCHIEGANDITQTDTSLHSTKERKEHEGEVNVEKTEDKMTRVHVACQVNADKSVGEEEGSLLKSEPDDSRKSSVGRSSKGESGIDDREKSGRKEDAINDCGVCTTNDDTHEEICSEKVSNKSIVEERLNQKAEFDKEVERLTNELNEAREALQRHREQARELLGQKDEALKRVQQKLIQVQQRRKAADQIELDLRNLADGGSNTVASLGLMSDRLAGGFSDNANSMDSGVLVQQMALRHTQALAEVQDQLQQAREEALRAQQEAERLRSKLQEQRSEQQKTVSRQSSCGSLPSNTSSVRKDRSVESATPGHHHGEDGIIRDAEYLRNVLIRYVQYQRAGNEKAARSLLPVLATVLKMNEEEKKIMLSAGSGDSSATGGIYAAVAQQLGLQL
ncbi:grip domain protein [Cystoisospora suis]|uniref:Grip domain protein n=1 Tax=Cystoisospora suis TaxID=483139 RepID=A0A2C6KHH6_9APIC|nr:grip domain protein [Cystoisospora suis]